MYFIGFEMFGIVGGGAGSHSLAKTYTIYQKKKNWNEIRFRFSSWMIKVIRHTIYFFPSTGKIKNDFLENVISWPL